MKYKKQKQIQRLKKKPKTKRSTNLITNTKQILKKRRKIQKQQQRQKK